MRIAERRCATPSAPRRSVNPRPTPQCTPADPARNWPSRPRECAPLRATMTVAELKQSVDLTHPRRAGHRIPADLRRALLEHLTQARSHGGKELGTLPARTLDVLHLPKQLKLRRHHRRHSLRHPRNDQNARVLAFSRRQLAGRATRPAVAVTPPPKSRSSGPQTAAARQLSPASPPHR
jgi:hypothetical protein